MIPAPTDSPLRFAVLMRRTLFLLTSAIFFVAPVRESNKDIRREL